MEFTLNSDLQPYFSRKQNLFDQIMSLQGQVYRELEGRRTQRIVLGSKGYFLKQHFGVGWREIFKNWVSGRLPVVSAKNEMQAIQLFNQLGLDTLTLEGYGCRGMNPAKRQSFLLTEELTDIISLEDLCRDWKATPPHFPFKQLLLKKVASRARIMHQNGLNHRDFYICHFLWQSSTEKLFVIDLHRAQIRKAVPSRWLIKDLAGLYFSSKDIGLTTRDLFRFVREYRKRPLREVWSKEQHFWRKVIQRGDKTYQEHE